MEELQRQVTLEQYNEQRNHWAFLAAVITNNFSRIIGMFSKRKPKLVEVDDFMHKDAKKMLQRLLKQDESETGAEPKPEQKDWSRHIEDAKAKGLAGPGGENTC
jgi:hypothetical protein